MRELFVYYRVQLLQAHAALAAVRAFQASLLEQYPQLRARLLRRPGETDGEQTWMEIYATDLVQCPVGISEAMQADIEAQARGLSGRVSGLASNTRHVEVFIAMDP